MQAAGSDRSGNETPTAQSDTEDVTNSISNNGSDGGDDDGGDDDGGGATSRHVSQGAAGFQA